ncbi:hypothetical protein DPMN_123532 [Dreissena polymorpha]|uniref:Uncharacterized protein n=1 Tax=Dreissena polymorpha TaxID=45954 RepID=A0A9D4JRD6_DREPO|nr:hypothetical protein DPMN_123532 [Dreissena polymorpha]
MCLDQPVESRSLVRSYIVCIKDSQGFLGSSADREFLTSLQNHTDLSGLSGATLAAMALKPIFS